MRTSFEKEPSDKCLNNTWASLNAAFLFFYITAFSLLATEMLGDEISPFRS